MRITNSGCFLKDMVQRPMNISRRGFVRLGILGGVGLAGGVGFINSRSPELVRQEVFLENLPSSFDGLKIAQITDIHAGPLVPPELIRAGMDLLRSVDPDLVVMTGDFISGPTRFLWTSYGGFSEGTLDYCLKELSSLKAPLGAFAVFGNHDFWAGPKNMALLEAGLKSIGVRVLRNENLLLHKDNQIIVLGGVDDYWSDTCRLPTTFQGSPPAACRILLSHNPDVNELIEATNQRVDLIISGHTHGGQIIVPFWGSLYNPSPFGQKYLAGLIRDNSRQTYVSRGLGLFFVPIRLNAPADVSLLVLRQKKA